MIKKVVIFPVIFNWEAYYVRVIFEAVAPSVILITLYGFIRVVVYILFDVFGEGFCNAPVFHLLSGGERLEIPIIEIAMYLFESVTVADSNRAVQRIVL